MSESSLNASEKSTGGCERSRWLFYVPMSTGTFASMVSLNIFITAGCSSLAMEAKKSVGRGTFGSLDSSCRALAARRTFRSDLKAKETWV